MIINFNQIKIKINLNLQINFSTFPRLKRAGIKNNSKTTAVNSKLNFYFFKNKILTFLRPEDSIADITVLIFEVF